MNLKLFFVKWEFQKMEKYLTAMGKGIESELVQLEEQYKELVDNHEDTHENELSIILDNYLDETIDVGHGFPQLLLSSFIIAWYSYVEQELLDFCEQLNLSIVIRPTDRIRFGSGIDRAYKFLLDIGNYRINQLHWSELKRISKLRNKLVHHGERLRWTYKKPEGKSVPYDQIHDGKTIPRFVECEPDLFKYLIKQNLIKESAMWVEIRPTFDFCYYLTEFGIELFSQLHTDLPKKP